MKQSEYKYMTCANDPDKITELLNEQGNLGWEFVSMVEDDNNKFTVIIYFKREL